MHKETEKTMNEYKMYHPLVNFSYFAFVIGFACTEMHPFMLCSSLFCSFLYQPGRISPLAIRPFLW